MYTSGKYIGDILDRVPEAVNKHRKPFDVFTYSLQGQHNVYAFSSPIFYQADAKNNANKWEAITRTPLRKKPKFRLGYYVMITCVTPRQMGTARKSNVSIRCDHECCETSRCFCHGSHPRYDTKRLFQTWRIISGMPTELHGRYEQGDEFAYNERIFDLPTDKNIDLFGYFQSEKYFKHIEDAIRENYEFKDEIIEKAKAIKSDLDLKKTVSLHVRRGDYLQLSHVHPTSEDVSYYDEAMTPFGGQLLLFFQMTFNGVKKICHT